MKIKLSFLKFLLIVGVVVAISSCDSTSQENTDTKDSTEVISDNQNQDQTFYLIPSPEDMFAFTEKGKLTFSPKAMNPIENADKYADTKSKELNFGIFSADLAYAASFSNFQETKKYLKVVRELSDDLGISAVFNESLIKRIDNIIANKDSLKRVTSDSYQDIVKYLEKNQRKRTLALIATGGWLESLYIVTNLVPKYVKDNETIQLIADQKMIFNNLMSYLDQNKSDEQVKATLDDLTPIKLVFDQLQEEKIESKAQKSNQPNQISVGGTSKIVITEAQYKLLRDAIAKVRNKMTGNNV